ncbi:MAG: hypothetical protein QXT77_07020 [Candidatus Methanomethylicaceae archaeon]
MVAVIGGFLFLSLSMLFLRVGFTRWYNKNVLAAGALAEDIIELVREKSVEEFDDFINFINQRTGGKDVLEMCLCSEDFVNEFGPLPAVIDELPEARSLSYVRFDVVRGFSGVEKVLVKVIVRWKETGRWTEKMAEAQGYAQEREYVLATTIAKSGLRVLLR